MPQIRYYNYGSTLNNETEKRVNYSLNKKGVYRGFLLTVDTNTPPRLVLNPGSGLMPNGIVWEETTQTTFQFTAPAVATTYSLVATHEDRSILGGVPVEYTLEDVLIANEDLESGLVIGWIEHPGFGLPLSEDYIIQAPKYADSDYAAIVMTTAPFEMAPPFTSYADISVGSDLTITRNEFDAVHFLGAQRVANSPTAVPPVQQYVQSITLFVKGGYRPIEIDLYTEFASSAPTNLVVSLYDTNQAPVTPLTGATIVGTGAWTTNTVTIPRTVGTFDEGSPYTIRLTHNVNLGEYIRVGRIVVKFWPFY